MFEAICNERVELKRDPFVRARDTAINHTQTKTNRTSKR